MSNLKSLLLRNPKISEFTRFGIVGSVALIILYAVYYVLLFWIEHNIAYTIGYIISFVSNYILTVKFTFHTKVSKRNGAGFALSHFVNYLLQIGCLNLFLWLGMTESIAPIPVFAICVPTNFVLVRFFMKK